jgi:hypothetical protein
MRDGAVTGHKRPMPPLPIAHALGVKNIVDHTLQELRSHLFVTRPRIRVSPTYFALASPAGTGSLGRAVD